MGLSGPLIVGVVVAAVVTVMVVVGAEGAEFSKWTGLDPLLMPRPG